MYEAEKDLLKMQLKQVRLALKDYLGRMFVNKYSHNFYVDGKIATLVLGSNTVTLTIEGEGVFTLGVDEEVGSGEIEPLTNLPMVYQIELLSKWGEIKTCLEQDLERQLAVVRDFKI